MFVLTSASVGAGGVCSGRPCTAQAHHRDHLPQACCSFGPDLCLCQCWRRMERLSRRLSTAQPGCRGCRQAQVQLPQPHV